MNLGLRPLLLLVVLVLGFAVGMATLLNYFKFESTVKKLQRSRIALVAAEVQGAIEKNLTLGIAVADSTTLQDLIDRQRGSDPLIRSIDIVDDAGKVLFSTERGRAAATVPETWMRAAQRPGAADWFVAEPDAFVTALVVRNSFDVLMGGVAVRYERGGFDRTVSAMGAYLTQTGALVAGAAAVLAVVALFGLMTQVKRDFAAAARVLAPEAGGTVAAAGASVDRGDSALAREMGRFRDGTNQALTAIAGVDAALADTKAGAP